MKCQHKKRHGSNKRDCKTGGPSPGVRRYLADEIKQANIKDLTYEKFLYNLLLKEYDLRLESGKKYNQVGWLSLPEISGGAIDRRPPSRCPKKAQGTEKSCFIENGQNVILAGSPSTGKTHLVIGLGIKACMFGYKVLFATVSLMVNQLKESRSERTLRGLESKFEKKGGKWSILIYFYKSGALFI